MGAVGTETRAMGILLIADIRMVLYKGGQHNKLQYWEQIHGVFTMHLTVLTWHKLVEPSSVRKYLLAV